MREVRLDPVPSPARSVARALGAASRAMVLRRTPGPGGVPDVAYVAEGVTAEPERLTAYQHLLGEPATDDLPAGFVHVLAFPVAVALMAREDFPLPVLGMVHVTNQVDQVRPLRLGTPLTVRAHARGLAPHRRGTQVELVTEVGAEGAVAWREVATYLAKGVHLAGEAGPEADAEPPRGDRTADAGPATARWHLPADVGRRYAAISGDRNPIHLSTLTARPFGYRRPVAHGMYTAALALAQVGRARGESFTWNVAFEAPVLLPARLDVRVAPDDGAFAYACWSRSRRHVHGAVVPR